MKIKGLGSKVSLIVTIMVAVIVGLTIYIVTAQTNGLLDEIASSNAESANNSLKTTLGELEDEAYARANIIRTSSDVIRLIQSQEINSLGVALSNFKVGLDVVIVYDKTGKFMAGSDSSIHGGVFDNEKDIQDTLSSTQGIKTIVEGTDGSLYTYGSAAIRASDGTVIGVVVCSHDLALDKYVDKVKERSNCEVSIFRGDTRLATTLVGDDGERVVGQKASEEVIEKVLDQGGVLETRFTLFGNMYQTTYTPLIVDEEIIGILFTGVNIDSALQHQANMIRSVIIAIAVSGALCIVLIIFFSRAAISRPLGKISLFAERIRKGDLGISSGSGEISIDVYSNDEVGVMAKSLENAFVELRGYIGEIGERMQGMADGDLVTESAYEFQGDFILIRDAINDIIRRNNSIMKNVRIAAAQVSVSSTQIADGAKLLADGSNIQASSVDQLSATIGEIFEETSQNAKVAKEANELSSAIRDAAEKGSEHMEKMMQSIKAINEASNQINKVIKVIDDIAFQTNILALNAAVEAARAGIHGKGFAVVAEEVGELASKSAVAANDTARLIADSVARANAGLKIAYETSESLQAIVDGINRSAEIITQISKSSEDQADSISQINTGIDQVAQVVRQNSATAEESVAASEEMNEQSLILQQMVQHFKVDGKTD